MHLLIAALANERRKTLLAEAEHARRIAPARRNGTLSRRPDPQPGRRGLIAGRSRRPETSTQPVPAERMRLLDGSSVVVRPIRPTDAPLLSDAFNRLSAASRRARFLGSKDTLSSAELRRLTAIDHREHEALIAISSADHRAVGVARYVRSLETRHLAELAVTVVDEWHRRGLGRALVDRLAERARTEGIGAFTALVADHNAGALALLRRFRERTEILDSDFGVTEYALDLAWPRGQSLAACGR
jgi:RimJ/RimL family protein N-acetyltransferase